MTEGQPNQATNADALRPGLLSRLVEPLWRGDAMRAARAASLRPERVAFFSGQARVAAELGDLALDPNGPFRAGHTVHHAAALFVEAIGWALRALAAQRSEGSVGAPSGAELRAPSRSELEALLTTEGGALLQASGSADVLARVTEQLLERGFDVRSQRHDELQPAVRELGRVCSRLLGAISPAQSRVETLMLERMFRLALALLLLVGLVRGGVGLAQRAERAADLTVGKPWTASSIYQTVCASPERDCEAGKSYFFFHTREQEGPWLELDLLRPEQMSRIHVQNRPDCCGERAVPLVVEVSSDHQTWREVIRRTSTFTDWQASFSPVTARWVRFRVARKSLLHLKDVRVLR